VKHALVPKVARDHLGVVGLVEVAGGADFKLPASYRLKPL